MIAEYKEKNNLINKTVIEELSEENGFLQYHL